MKSPQKVSREVFDRVITLLLGGLGFAAALAWNDAAQALFRAILPTESASVVMKFFYAGVITVIITVVSLRLSRYASEAKAEEPDGNKNRI